MVPETTVEVIKFRAINKNESTNLLSVTTTRNNIREQCSIEISLLRKALDMKKSATIDDIIKYFPAYLECDITGNQITNIIKVISYTPPPTQTTDDSDESTTTDDDETTTDTTTSESESELDTPSDSTSSPDSTSSYEDEESGYSDEVKSIEEVDNQSQSEPEMESDDASIIEVKYEPPENTHQPPHKLLTEEEIKKENEREFLQWVNAPPGTPFPNPTTEESPMLVDEVN